MCNLDPVCDHDKCGFGECAPWSARESQESLASGGIFAAAATYEVRHPLRKGKYGYRCLCNECFTEQVVNGERTCVRDATCEPKNYCDPNPCKCGGTCTLCPSCALNGGNPYVCQCAGTFGGASCDELACPPGMMDTEETVGADVCTRRCTPIENSNPCDAAPCMHGGICTQKPVIEPGMEALPFTCDCPENYTGEKCETLVCPRGYKIIYASGRQECIPDTAEVVTNSSAAGGDAASRCKVCDDSNSPCSGNGYCQVADDYCTEDSIQCTCKVGFEGMRCETQVKVCDSYPCAGDETCQPSNTAALGYTCEKARRALTLLNTGNTADKNALRTSHFRKLARSMFADKIAARRSLADGIERTAPGDIQIDWDEGGALPLVKPLLPKRGVPSEAEIKQQCTVWQNSKNFRSELVLTVKCPGDDVEACKELISVLDTKHRYGDWHDLESWTRFNCIGAHDL